MNKAFSLVELSIVLVILGLLTGGVLAGKSLIRASELRSVSADLSRFRAAAYTFRDKYFYLPGDLANATAFWGDRATGTGACADPAVADGSPGTCNGNGDGKIDLLSATNEGSLSWQHLARAGLVEGEYSGINNPVFPGVNLPRGRVSNTGFALYWSSGTGVASSSGSDPNRFMFGTAGSSTMSGAALRPVETWNIDTKLDDGAPQTGKVISRTGTTGATGTCSSGVYTLSNDDIACAFTYAMD